MLFRMLVVLLLSSRIFGSEVRVSVTKWEEDQEAGIRTGQIIVKTFCVLENCLVDWAFRLDFMFVVGWHAR